MAPAGLAAAIWIAALIIIAVVQKVADAI